MTDTLFLLWLGGALSAFAITFGSRVGLGLTVWIVILWPFSGLVNVIAQARK